MNFFRQFWRIVQFQLNYRYHEKNHQEDAENSGPSRQQ
jgi:hypothetical protein